MDEYVAALDRAHRHTLDWLASLPDRPVPPRAGIDEVVEALGPALPESGTAAGRRRRPADRGLRAGADRDALGPVLRLGHRRRPAGRARRGLAGQRLGPERRPAPAHPGAQRRRGRRRRLAAGPARPPGRQRRRLRDRGDDGELHRPRRRPRRRAAPRRLGRRGARPGRRPAGPGARRCGAPRHGRPGAALPRPRGARAGRRPTRRAGSGADALADALPRRRRGPGPPTIVVLQAGNVHSGAFDPFARGVDDGARARRLGARRRCVRAVGGGRAGRAGTWSPASTRADSWATDAHKTLNVPYDCGLAIVRDPAAVRAADGHARAPT